MWIYNSCAWSIAGSAFLPKFPATYGTNTEEGLIEEVLQYEHFYDSLSQYCQMAPNLWKEISTNMCKDTHTSTQV